MLYIFVPEEGSNRNRRIKEELDKKNIEYEELENVNSINKIENKEDHKLLTIGFNIVTNMEQINKTDSCLLGNDKYISYLVARYNGIKTPKTYVTPYKTLEYPFVVKPRNGSLGNCVELVHNEMELNDAIKNIISIGDKPIFQECIEESYGKSIRVLCIDKKFVAAELLESNGGFQSNAHQGATGKTIELSEEEKALAEKIATTFDLNYCGIDFLLSKDGIIFLEINPAAQYDMLETTTGINIAEKIVEYFNAK